MPRKIAGPKIDYTGIYIYMAKASFSAYVLGNFLLKTGEKVHFSTKKHDRFWSSFLFLPFSFFSSKGLTYVVFAFQKAKKVGRKRGLRHIYIYVLPGNPVFSVKSRETCENVVRNYKKGSKMASRKTHTNWSAANGGVTNGGLRGVWPPVLEIGRNRPFLALFLPFSTLFRRARRAPGKSRKRRKKAFFLRYPRICLNPPSLKPPFAALQTNGVQLRTRKMK